MLLLAFHIVAIGILVVGVGYVAYQAGYSKAEQRIARRLGHGAKQGPYRGQHPGQGPSSP